MVNSVVAGPLRSVEKDHFIIGSGLKIMLKNGMAPPTFPIGTSVTVIAVRQELPLRDLIRAKIRDGRLPTERFKGMWAGS